MTPNGTPGHLSADLFGILALAHPNVLLIGPRTATDHVVDLLRQYVRLPVATWSPREAQTLPTESPGALLIPAIDTANIEQQSQLCAWLDARSGLVQVLSSSVRPLFPLVMGGAFLERLYYQLNHLYVDLTAGANQLPV